MNKPKLLITGIAGFIGFHLAKYLINQKKFLIVGLDNVNDYYSQELKFSRLDELGLKNACKIEPKTAYKPKTSLVDGLTAFYEWYKKYKRRKTINA